MAINVTFYEKCTKNAMDDLLILFQEQFQTSFKWSIEEVEISKIIPLCKHVYDKRLNFARKSILNCIQNNIPLFHPYIVHYDNGSRHLVAPPIIEERNQLLYLGDGMHRIYSLLELNITKVYVLVTRQCMLPLPGKPQNWNDVKKELTQLPHQMNFDNFMESGFTGYSRFCNSKVFWTYLDEKG